MFAIMSTDSDFPNSCQECGSTNIIEDEGRGELTCAACGLVIESSRISFDKEWRAYNADDENSRSRVGDPETPLIAARTTPVTIRNRFKSNSNTFFTTGNVKRRSHDDIDRTTTNKISFKTLTINSRRHVRDGFTKT